MRGSGQDFLLGDCEVASDVDEVVAFYLVGSVFCVANDNTGIAVFGFSRFLIAV